MATAASGTSASGKKPPSLTHWRKYFSPRQWKPNSIVVITGASSGIGRELALQYAARKCRLVLAARSETELNAVAELCRRVGSTVCVCVTDVTIESQCNRLMTTAVDTFGGIDILILNAGVGCHHAFGDTKDSSVFQHLMNVNFFGYLNCTRAAFPHLTNSRGLIVVVSSMSGEIGLPYRTAYCASKYAVTGCFEALRAELDAVASDKASKHPIDITIVCPPSVDTGLRAHSLTVKGESPISDKPDKNAISAGACAALIIEAADRRLRKVYFPLSSYIGVYLRPFFPDFVDHFARKRSKL